MSTVKKCKNGDTVIIKTRERFISEGWKACFDGWLSKKDISKYDIPPSMVGTTLKMGQIIGDHYLDETSSYYFCDEMISEIQDEKTK